MVDKLIVKSDYSPEQVDTLRLLALLTGHEVQLVKVETPQIRIFDAIIQEEEEKLAGLTTYNHKILFLTYPGFDLQQVVSDKRKVSTSLSKMGLNMITKTIRSPEKPDRASSMCLYQIEISNLELIKSYGKEAAGAILLGDGTNLKTLAYMKAVTPEVRKVLGAGAKIVYAVDKVSFTDKKDEVGTMCKFPVGGEGIDCVLVDLTTQRNSFNTALELLVSKIL